MNANNESEKKSECRALVALAPQDHSVRMASAFPAAPFLVQLTANVKGFDIYRVKRRADPETCAVTYRAANERPANTRESRTVAWL